MVERHYQRTFEFDNGLSGHYFFPQKAEVQYYSPPELNKIQFKDYILSLTKGHKEQHESTRYIQSDVYETPLTEIIVIIITGTTLGIVMWILFNMQVSVAKH